MTDEQATSEQAPEAAAGVDVQLSREFASRGLALAAASGGVPALAGPLSAVGFAPPDEEGAARIAAAVIAGDDLEPFDLAVAAIQAANMDLAPATAVSIETVDELIATIGQPREVLTILADGAPIGVVVSHADRRKPVGAADPGRAAAATAAPSGAGAGLGLLQDVVLEVTVELGRTALPLAQLMNLGIGSVVELDRSAGAPVDVRVNGTLFAKGEVVVVDNEYAVRIIEILPPQGH